MIRLLLFIFIFHSFMGCTQSKQDSWIYSINKPDDIYELPSKLNEISGISFIDDDVLACVEDEHGILYQYNLSKRKITSELNFSPNGDFEDISIVGDTAYALRSDGFVFEISNYNSSSHTRKFRILSKDKRNLEGLFFMPVDKRFLIAHKEDNSFSFFDLVKEEIIGEPIPIKKKHFSPSAIAIHPFSGEIYLLSSVNKSLLIVDKDGTTQSTIKLQNRLFIQPEGVAFNSAGDLFISNEGRGGKSNILMFRYQHMDDK